MTPLTRQFPLTRLWDGIPCSREGCITCEQGGEEIYPCTRRSLTYKNICLRCHPGGGEKKEKLDNKVEVPAVYIGETSRSLYERGRDHWRDYNEGRENSHILNHHVLHHGGEGVPRFHLRPLAFHKTALNRQLSEAVRIDPILPG